jgi:hypothetical protein
MAPARSVNVLHLSAAVPRPASSASEAFDRLIICAGMVQAMVPERSPDNDEEE